MIITKKDWKTKLLVDVFRDEISTVQPKVEFLDAAISLLKNERHRQYLYEHYRDGMKYTEMAKIHQCSASTISSRCHHALWRLRSGASRKMLLNGPEAPPAVDDEKKYALQIKEIELADRADALAEREERFEKRVSAFRFTFPSLANILPANPAWEQMGLSELNIPFDIRDDLNRQFSNVMELFKAAQNPKLRIRGITKLQMKKVREALKEVTGLPVDVSTDPAVAHRFPDWNAIKPGDWSATPVVLQYARNRKPLEIGLYREPITGEYSLQVFSGDTVLFRETVDVSLMMEDEE